MLEVRDLTAGYATGTVLRGVSLTVAAGELLARLAALSGVEQVDEVRLFRFDPRTGTRVDGWSSRMELGRGALPFSVDHRVEVVTS